MSNPEIESDVPICEFELKKELEKNLERDKELNFRAGKTVEYLNDVVKLSYSKGKDMKKAVESLNIPRMKSEAVVKIVDIMPTNEEDLKMVLQSYSITVSQANIKAILDAIK
jgi:DNA-directed RNA polymerase subunit F